MAKSTINILQEYCIKQYKKYPDYQTRDTSSGCSPLFTVECIIGNVSTRGVGTTKIAAKTAATEEMMRKLGIAHLAAIHTTPPRGTPSGTPENYIGLLNELCSKNAMPYPTYIEGMQGTTFTMECQLKGLTTTGLGSNKKSAKQDSAREMLQKYHLNAQCKRTADITNLIDLGLSTLSIYDPPASPPQSSQNNNVFVPPKGTDYISTLNLYCDKYQYKKPEYFQCGQDGNLYVTKCRYQSFATQGKGLTTKFAKQDSAMQMLEIIGIKQEDKPQTPVPAFPTNSKSLQVSDKTVIDIYKQKSPILKQDPIVDDLISFDDYAECETKNKTNCMMTSSHPELHQMLLENNVKYDLEVMQSSDPCIVLFRGKRLMPNGNVIEKHFMEMGDKYQDLVGVLLQQAVQAFV